MKKLSAKFRVIEEIGVGFLEAEIINPDIEETLKEDFLKKKIKERIFLEESQEIEITEISEI